MGLNSTQGKSQLISFVFRRVGGEIRLLALSPPLVGSGTAQAPKPSILNAKGEPLFAPLRFIWNATRGHRLTPWRSDYVRWRVETYSGMRAETLTAKDILNFAWTSRWELLSYLAWTGRIDRDVHKRA
jgi:hypothetical protein